MSDKLYDINTVCNMLGTTSRTLRFYEEKQIIKSTKVFDSPRRQYTAEQIDCIRNVLVLRALGLSISDIRDLQKQDGGFAHGHRAEQSENICTYCGQGQNFESSERGAASDRKRRRHIQ